MLDVRILSPDAGEKLGRRRFLFHVPHDGGECPAELAESLCVPRELFLLYGEMMRDTGISGMIPEEYRFGWNGEPAEEALKYAGSCARFPVSRLLCDVERFADAREEMEKYGMGFCCERVYDGTVIKSVTEEARSRALAYYRAHHERMDALCGLSDRVLIFDLHSYSDELVPRGRLAKNVPTPDICIGYDPEYTPQELVVFVSDAFCEAGYSVAVNYPYSGTFVPGAVMAGRSGCDCISIMIEVHKRTYLRPVAKAARPAGARIAGTSGGPAGVREAAGYDIVYGPDPEATAYLRGRLRGICRALSEL